MNNKIKNYVEVIFQEVPRSKKAVELKEEILSNLNDRFEDYISQGKTETESYGLAVANMGDLDEMINEVMPTEDFVKEANTYRKRNARNTAIGVSLYIVGVTFLILCGSMGDMIGFEEFGGIIGLTLLLLCSAIATSLIVYSNMSTPKEFKDYEGNCDKELESMKTKDRKIYEAISSIYWTLTTLFYLLVSFMTMAWHITWIIWVIAGVLHQIITTIFQLRGGDFE